mmetsp:Transcript_7253/g.22863  ORF Transcript_7253/g.22863 Transcript_7253/m.22863 type:complete len:424 (-) Transcript_7253:34-1305(-)
MTGAGEPTCGLTEALVFLGALIAGTSCSLCSKVLLGMRSVGLSGEEEAFQNPLFQTWGMFLGMIFALPVHFIREALAKRKKRRGYETIDAKEPEFKEMPASTYLLLAIPSLFDLAATALCMYGLTYIAVSIYQMLRGAAIVFVAILKHFVLKDKLTGFMWVGVGLNVVAILLVGATATSGDGGPDKNPLVGVGLILAGAFVQSLQYAFEEKVMSSDVGAPPLLVIGMEGFWGFFVCTFVLYPALYAAGIEDPFDTWAMFCNSPQIQGMFLLYFVSIFCYNLLAVLVTYMLNSVWHAILDNFRPISVWGLDLFLFYVLTRGSFGEAWVWPGSYVQILALVVLLYGTAVYNGSVKVPGCEYPPEPSLVPPSPLPVVRASPAMASSSLMKSPLIHGTPASRRPSTSPRMIPTITEMPVQRARSGSM